VQWSFISIE